MHKCVVCTNTSAKTRLTRPEVLYHAFPNNDYRRKKWLKVYGIEHCYDWHRICSDHFLPQNYRPGKKRFLKKDTIPLPYRNSEVNDGSPSDYTTQSTDVKADNNNVSARDQNSISYTTQSTDVETGNNNVSAKDQNPISYTTQSADVETGNNYLLASDQNPISYTTQSTDVETGNNNVSARDQNPISYTTQSTDVETGNNNVSAREQNPISYTTQSTDVETGNNYLSARDQNPISYNTQRTEVETGNNNLSARDQNPISYNTQRTEVETGNNNLSSRNQNLLREEQRAVVNNFESPRRSCRKIKLTTTNEDMSYENMPWLQTERFEAQNSTFVANDNIQPVIENVEVTVLTTTKDYTLGGGPRCSVKNCLNRYSKDLSFFGYPSDFELRKEWIEKCRLEVDPSQKVKPGIRVCRAHFEDHCFLNPERKNRLKPNAVPTLFLDGDDIEARNKPSPIKRSVKKRAPANKRFIRTNKNRPSCSATNYVAKIGSQVTPLLVYIDSTIRSTKDFEARCCVPGCITNTIENEDDDISLFAAPKERLNAWSSSLNLQLTLNNIVCERHFRPQDMLHPTLLVNGVDRLVKSLVPSALPVRILAPQPASTGMPLDAVESASNDMPLETNEVPVLRTYAGHLKRHKTDEQLLAKRIKTDILDKSKAATNKMYFSKNENEEHAMVKNDTSHDNSTCDLNEKSEPNTVIPVDLSIVKIEPNDEDNDLESETKTDQLLPTIKPEPVENNDLLPLSSIDDSLSISLKKLKKISNSSLSITLEPIDSTKITEPSVSVSSKTSDKSSISISLQSKLHNNFSSTTHNSSPSVSLINSLPSTSSSSVYNIPLQSPLQYNPEATSTLKMLHKLSSNTVIHPKIIDKQIISLKPIPNTNTSNLSELPKMQTPVISNCISLAVKSPTHSNSDSSKNNPEVIIIDDDDNEAFIEEDNGFIYEISKIVTLPNLFWMTEHVRSLNSTNFCRRDNFHKIIKKIYFNNSLVPTIRIYGKKYEYNKPIKTKNELHNLIKKIDGIVKCVGFRKFANVNCIGFYEGNSKDVRLCSSCQKKYQELLKSQKFRTETTESLEQRVSEKSVKFLKLNEYNEKNIRSPRLEEDHTSLINYVVPHH